MVAERAARIERANFCDVLTELGPDRPTLCSPWTTKDLAAHIVIRERRPDAAAGITLPLFAKHTAAVQAATARSHSFEELIDLIRNPPWYSLAALTSTDNATNTAEFFIHTEDARRADGEAAPRPLDPAVARVLSRQLRLLTRLRLRQFPGLVTVNVTGSDQPIIAGRGQRDRGDGPEVTMTGDVGEIILFLNGRQRVSNVELAGPDPAVARLRGADFSL